MKAGLFDEGSVSIVVCLWVWIGNDGRVLGLIDGGVKFDFYFL